MAAPLITIPEMAVALRLEASINEVLDSTIVGILAREMVAGIEQITSYAPDAPEPVASEALVRLVGFYFDRPSEPTPFVSSGAKAMLAYWHIPLGTKV